MFKGLLVRKFRFLFQTTWIIMALFSWNPLLQVSFGQSSNLIQLREMFGSLRKPGEDSAKTAINDDIQRRIRIMLEDRTVKLSLSDSIPGLVILHSEDGRISFYQWNIQWKSGKHQYFGFLKVNERDAKAIWNLGDRSDHGPASDTLVTSHENWFGALYYKIIDVESPTGPSYYTLLGWSGQDQTITGKVIEILKINDKGEPVFGSNVFEGYQRPGVKRVVYRFSASTTMNLKYENQVISTRKIWNKRKRVFDSVESRGMLIVADRIEPMDPLMESMFQFYIPAGDLHDGFIMNSGKWQFHPGIETRNTR